MELIADGLASLKERVEDIDGRELFENEAFIDTLIFATQTSGGDQTETKDICF